MRNDKGFTFIELLVVIAIVTVLAAIAIPRFTTYKMRAYNAVAVTDLKNSVIAQESIFVDNLEYISCADPANCENDLPGFKATREAGAPSVTTFTHTASADGQSFEATARHGQGNVTYTYSSLTARISQS